MVRADGTGLFSIYFDDSRPGRRLLVMPAVSVAVVTLIYPQFTYKFTYRGFRVGSAPYLIVMFFVAGLAASEIFTDNVNNLKQNLSIGLAPLENRAACGGQRSLLMMTWSTPATVAAAA